MLRRIIALPFILLTVYLCGFAYALIAREVNAAEMPFGAWVEAPHSVIEATLAQLGALARLDFGGVPPGSAALTDERAGVAGGVTGGALADGRLLVVTADGKVFAVGM